MFRKLMTVIAFVVGIFLVSQSVPSWQPMAAQNDKGERGRKLYQQYCASCHGMDGKGGGIVAPTLKTSVPDLTTIEKRNGKFDQIRVQNIIAGEIGITAHGEKDMPVWGYIFRHKSGQTISTVNVYALATYVKSIQEK